MGLGLPAVAAPVSFPSLGRWWNGESPCPVLCCAGQGAGHPLYCSAVRETLSKSNAPLQEISRRGICSVVDVYAVVALLLCRVMFFSLSVGQKPCTDMQSALNVRCTAFTS